MIKKTLFSLFLFSTIITNAQNSIQIGFDGLVPQGFYKGWAIMPNLGYSIGLGEQWSVTPGLGFYFKAQKNNYELYPKITSNALSSFSVKSKTTGVFIFADFKKYFGKSSNEDGGFYGKIGGGILPMNFKNTADNYDTTAYYPNTFLPNEKTESKFNFKVIKLCLGFDKEIVDLINIYVEVGAMVFIGEDYANMINIGIRKRFFSL